jgi:chromosome segregation protein
LEFTRLRVSGFKSFVDPTELYIEPGLTGVVGPNGCGKSNLLEALRWVMGETKPSNMRGSGMDDVIFAGTATRSSRNLAEVSLLLDNSDMKAPAALNDSENIEISRRIEREAGSAYRVNGRETRARDVHLLFADLATGAHSPSLVSQGRIGALINAKPRDRAALLEEAAGVAGLHSRRHEAELRLRAASTNLERLQDVMTQIEGQLGALKRQARQAARYRTLSTRLRAAEALMFHLRWVHAEAAHEDARQALAAIEVVVTERTRIQAKASADQATANAKVPPLRHLEAQRAAAEHRLTVAHENLADEEERTARELAQLVSRLEQVAQDEGRESAQITDASGHMERLEAEQKDVQGLEENHQQSLANEEARLNDCTNAVDKSRTLADAAGEEYTRISAQKESLTQQSASLDMQLGGLDRRIESAQDEHQKLVAAARNNPAAKEAAEVTSTARIVAEEAQSAYDSHTIDAKNARTAEAEARQYFEDARSELSPLQAEEKALSALIAESQTNGSPVLDAITVDPGYETALAAALGDDLSLATDETASAFWRGLDPMATIPALPAAATSLASHIKAPDALNRILGFIGIVPQDQGEALQQALAAGQLLVSAEGDVWRWDGKVSRAGTPSAAAVRLEQRNRIAALSIEIEALQASVNAAEAISAEANERTSEAVALEGQARVDLQSAQDALIKARNVEADIAQRDAKNNSRTQSLEETLVRMRADREEVAERKGEMVGNLAKMPVTQDYQDKLDAARVALNEAQEQLAEARQNRDYLLREAQQRQHRLKAITSELDSWRQRQSGAQGQIAQLVERKSQTQKELDAISAKPDALRAQRLSLTEEMEKAATARKDIAAELAEAESDLAGFDKALNEAQRNMAQSREEMVRAQGVVDQSSERISDLEERIEEELECEPEDTLEISEHKPDTPLPEMDDIAKRLERLRRERDTMGPVNLRADQEAEEIQTELTNMTTEKEDLEAAIEKLRRAISSLNREGRERLATAFTEVNAHFSDLFTRMFGGGEAHLALTESDDPLEAGLEIMASPPGKKLQSMSLLSGGEQALTALSLIFAVFMTNPAPICVLDEVDAPLDDANVERFCKLLHEITEETGTRFLVVSHHPITISHLDRLFGVTMGEQGVSQLVSVDLDQAEEMIAAE